MVDLEISDAALLARVADGDRGALNELYERHAGVANGQARPALR